MGSKKLFKIGLFMLFIQPLLSGIPEAVVYGGYLVCLISLYRKGIIILNFLLGFFALVLGSINGSISTALWWDVAFVWAISLLFILTWVLQQRKQRKIPESV